MAQQRRKGATARYHNFILADHKGLEKLWYIVFSLLILVLAASGYVILQIQDLSERIQSVPADGQMINTAGSKGTDGDVNGSTSDVDDSKKSVTNGSSSVVTDSGRVYARAWFSSPNEVASELYDVSGSEPRKVFSYQQPFSIFDIEGDEIVFSSNNNDYTEWRLELVTLGGDAHTLLKLEPKQGVTGGVRLSDGRIVFGVQCGFSCAPSAEEVLTTIYIMEPTSGKLTELFKESGQSQGFKVPVKFLNEDTVIMEPGYEATEGNPYIPEIYLLNVETGDVLTFKLSDKATSFTPGSDGQSIVYTTFEYSLKPQKTDSRIVRKSLDGKETILEESDVLEYRQIVWRDTSTLLALATSVETVEEGLGYFVLGPRTARVIDVEAGVKDVLSLVENQKEEKVTDLHAVVGDYLYYNSTKDSQSPLGSDTFLHRFDLGKKKDQVIMQKDRHITVFVDD